MPHCVRSTQPEHVLVLVPVRVVVIKLSDSFSSPLLSLQIRRNVSSSAPGGSSSRAPEFEHEPFLEVCIGAIRCGASVKTESFSHLQVREIVRCVTHIRIIVSHTCVLRICDCKIVSHACVSRICDCNIVSHACATAMLCLTHAH
jgi:hypothetical protein